MFSFIIMALALIGLGAIVLSVVAVGGVTFIAMFSDIIVCALFVYWIAKLILKKKNSK